MFPFTNFGPVHSGSFINQGRLALGKVFRLPTQINGGHRVVTNHSDSSPKVAGAQGKLHSHILAKYYVTGVCGNSVSGVTHVFYALQNTHLWKELLLLCHC